MMINDDKGEWIYCMMINDDKGEWIYEGKS